METTIEKGITYTYSTTKLNKVINDTIDVIKKTVKENNFQVSGKIEYYNFDFRMLSKNKMKKIQKYCYWINKKPTLRRINTLFGILARIFKVNRVTVKVSKIEEKIQLYRKEWLKARNESEILLAKYKSIKGNFYKSRNYLINS